MKFKNIKQKLGIAVLGLALTSPSFAASHREAPLISLDPAADITDFYMFRSPNNPQNAVIAMNVIPGQEPGSGPNYFNFDDDVLYEIYIDNNKNNIARDITYQFRFKTEIRSPGDVFPLSYAALPPITTLDGPGSEGLLLRQTYTVTEQRFGQKPKDLGTGIMVAVPSNVGPRTIPNYEALATQGIYPLSNGGRVYAGQRDETFYIDLGGVFDTLNLRNSPILSDADDADDGKNVADAPDTFSGFNVNTIAIEIPISELMGKDGNTVIGAYAATSRPRVTILKRDNKREHSSFVAQVARMGNPLVNELIIPTSRKDEWNATYAEFESKFVEHFCNPSLAVALNVVFGTTFPTSDRADLANLLLRYGDSAIKDICVPGALKGKPLADFLRVDLNTPPTPILNQKRLGVFARDANGNPTPDPNGWPNGRRPNDDVTDIALRAVAGALIDPATPALGDGVNFNIGAPGTGVTANGIASDFPFMPTPHDGRDRRHIDPLELP